MKNLIPILSAAAITASGSTYATEPAYSGVSGYYQFDGVAGGNVFVPALVKPSVFSGAINGSTDSTLSFPVPDAPAPPLLTAGAFDEGTVFPTHYVEFLTGPNTGVVVNIESNTGSEITLAANIADLNLVGNESVRIRPHVTLQGVLSGAEGTLAAFTDNATFYFANGSSITYVFLGEGSGWSSDFENPDGNEQPVAPGTGFILNLNSATPLTIVGQVKEEPTVVQLSPAVVNIVGPVNPLVGTSVSLSQTGFEDLAAFTDTITVYEAGALTSSTTYVPLGDGNLSSNFSDPTLDTLDNTTGVFLIPAAPSSLVLSPGFSISQ